MTHFHPLSGNGKTTVHTHRRVWWHMRLTRVEEKLPDRDKNESVHLCLPDGELGFREDRREASACLGAE